MANRKWTDDQLENAVKKSVTITSVLRALGLAVSGGGAHIIKKHIGRLNLDISHWQKVSKINASISLSNDSIFIINSPISNASIRRKIIKNNLIHYSCNECNIIKWRGKKISLQLDHINGNSKDNRLENLRWLCPNCHSQTDTWGSKKTQKKCVNCDVKITYSAKRCQKCANKVSPKKMKICWPDLDKLIDMIKENGYSATGRKLGVSDNAVRKFIKRNKK